MGGRRRHGSRRQYRKNPSLRPHQPSPLLPRPFFLPDFGTSTGSNSGGLPAGGIRRADKPPRHVPDIVACAGGEQSKHSIPNSRQALLQKKKDKRKSVMVPAPMSYPPAGRTGCFKSKRVNDVPGLLKFSSASLPTSAKAKKR